jgi:hypothetical protein
MEEQKARLEEAKAQPEISVVDYLASQGRQTSFSEREKLAKQYGIENYTGTAAQNTQLLNILKATPPPKEPTPEEKKDEETRKALLGGITPEQYEEQPYYKRPDETEEEYNKRIEGLRQAGVPEPPTRQDSIAEQIESGIYNPEDILKALNYDITGKKIGDYTITEIDEYLRENPLTPAQRFSSQLQNERETIDSAYRDYQSNINKLMAGEIPLTPEEQGQIDTINRTFDRLREKQLLANQNYERGITIAGISEGRQRYAPETHLGNIKQAVNEGIDEIAELDAKRLSMVNELKMAIKDKNYKMISESYDRFREYSSDKMKVLEGIYNVEQTELDKIEKALAEQEKLMREEQQRIQERKEDIMEDISKNLADETTKMNVMNAETIEEAILAAGDYLSDKDEATTSMKEYAFAVSQGYTGKFADWKKIKEGEAPEDKKLSILDVGRINEINPEADIIFGDTVGEVQAKIGLAKIMMLAQEEKKNITLNDFKLAFPELSEGQIISQANHLGYEFPDKIEELEELEEELEEGGFLSGLSDLFFGKGKEEEIKEEEREMGFDVEKGEFTEEQYKKDIEERKKEKEMTKKEKERSELERLIVVQENLLKKTEKEEIRQEIRDRIEKIREKINKL